MKRLFGLNISFWKSIVRILLSLFWVLITYWGLYFFLLDMHMYAYIRFYGSVEKCQTLFKRATAAVTDDPESIFRAWIEFEQYYGATIETLHFARQRIESQRQLLAERHEHVRASFAAAMLPISTWWRF